MADTITSSHNLAIGVEYTENKDTRTSTITIPNFKGYITEEQVKQAFEGNNVIIYGYDDSTGDPRPVVPANIVTASTTKQTITNIDIGWE